MDRRQASTKVSLAERLAFERLLGDLSALFANIPPERVITEIEAALARLVDFLGFDRSSFGEFRDEASPVEVLCSVARNGIEPSPLGAGPPLPWYFGALRAGQLLVLPDLPTDLPPEAQSESEYSRQTGLRSNLSIPLRVGGRVMGVIAFSAFHHTRDWPEDLIVRLKIVGEVFAQALARSRRETELAAALAEITRLKERLEAENSYLRQSGCARPALALASRSPRFNQILDEIAQVAPTSATVLLLGETGTGKEVLADAIHGLSSRRERPLIKVNCAALPISLIETELFGREKGAYTGALARQPGRFELADGGTLFLDEIGELPPELQTKLLRVLQDGSFERVGGTRTIRVDVRLIAATNRHLADAVQAGDFREDLFYRLNVFPIALPPLRERREDIPWLAWEFIKQFSESMGKPIDHVAEDSMQALLDHHWPGNVRELRNLIERAMILARGPTLHVALDHALAATTRLTMTDTLADNERAHILQILEQTRWRIRGAGGAAVRLGLKPTTLESRMKRLGLSRSG
ncbi:sigma 54-interacting transcriptional regulator [Allochromatium palmeri]|uniref:GAF domain-containing protein n=1 Tax=Allochromatium palmeri TaxID=231048 RepID=A0A6N8EE35_9GAMM|nr:sigma 54-interacting transcriptional regulator [Allochromatium palmeri]MTW20604.1 GAF domain-containing protein [Allochromatium palmeri]